MDVQAELRIEYSRLQRHVGDLEDSFTDAIARDLSACLRNWVQMEEAVDALAVAEGWQLTFWHQEKPKELRRLRNQGDFVSVPLLGAAKSTGVMVTGAVRHNRALTPDEIKRSYELGKSTLPQRRVMSFRDFLNGEGAEFRIQDVTRSIARRDFIERYANRLGGTHPMSAVRAEEMEHWADPYILEMGDIRLGPWPAPCAVLMETGQQVLAAFDVVAPPPATPSPGRPQPAALAQRPSANRSARRRQERGKKGSP
jgi:hypothetical protein